MGKKRRQPAEADAAANTRGNDVQPSHSGSKKASDVGTTANTAAARDKPSPPAPSPSKRASASIDALFGRMPKKQPVKKIQQHAEEQRAEAQQPKRRKGSKTDLFGNGPSPNRRYDEEGLPIYTTEELGIGKGGDTAACPFDCECCT